MSDRYKGAILSPTAPTVTSQSAGGVYTLSQQTQYQGQGVWPTAVNYPINNSLRFRSSASAYLNRTPATAGNRRTFTFSAWVKRGLLSNADQYIFTSSEIQDDKTRFNTDNTFTFQVSGFGLTTTAVFRDPAAWYHIVFTLDTTQATASNRMNIYINGVQQTSFSSDTRSSITQNLQTDFNNTVLHHIAKYYSGAGLYFDGYLAEVNFIDGVALTPSSFGTTDAYGIWQPIPYTGSYGTNGFYLPFTDNSALTTSSNVGLGKDFSGNGNYWVTNNISITAGSTYDSMKDVPTNTNSNTANYAVLNPLDTGGTAPTNGNLTLTVGAAERGVRSTFAIPTTGLYYAEALVGTNQSGATDIVFGFVARTTNLTATPFGASNVWAIYGSTTTQITRNGSTTNAGAGTALVSGDILQLAIDLTNNKGWVGKNNTWFNDSTGTDGNPSTGANPTFTFSSPPELFVLAHCYLSTIDVNFGQRPFSYTPPTGFLPLNTYNLPTPTILAGNQYMDATLYTGNGTSLSVTNSGSIQPDFVWIKQRNGTGYNMLFDSVRGVQKWITSNDTLAETTGTDNLSAFNSNGFTVLDGGFVNPSSGSMVGWQWRANAGTNISNTNGTITSTVSVNTTAGFSILTYTGNGSSTATVGHGLGVEPAMLIQYERAGGDWWHVWHTGLSGSSYNVFLNNSNAERASVNDGQIKNNGSSTFAFASTTSNVDAVNENGKSYVAYCFSQVAGYSAFGKYTGNGSSDGPFIYTGFRPRYVMIKRSDSTADWNVRDTARSPYNVVGEALYPNLALAEYSGSETYLDILSNGFKLRGNWNSSNASSGTYVYACFAENPFKIARGR
jgi:hypothetical protein